MSDLGTRIRRLVDDTAPPIDGMGIVQRSARQPARPEWVIGVAAGLGVLVGGLVTLSVMGWRPDRLPTVGPGSSTTVTHASTTVGTGSSVTTSPDESAAAARAEEARRRAAEEAARQAAARALPYLGLDLPGWISVEAGTVQHGCGDAPDPLLGVRAATYAAPGETGRHAVIEVISQYALCPSDDIPTSVEDLGPTPDLPAIDLGTTGVMGHDARVVEEGGVYWVMWLLDDPGSSARVIVFPGAMPLTIEAVVAISQGVVELSADQWEALVSSTP